MIYSTYCNCYPRALVELEQLSMIKEAAALLEECRINQNLPELPLSAHLLAPIQRICRYPLHLNELVKHTISKNETIYDSNEQSDCNTIDCKEMFDRALRAMKKVTEMVNEGMSL